MEFGEVQNVITLTLITIQLLFLAINEMYCRGLGPEVVQKIGDELFGNYSRSLIIYEIMTTSWIISGFNDIYGPSFAPRADMLVFFLFGIFVVAMIWIWQASRFEASSDV
ncbi:MAG: hypothetical protein EAX95_16295 [Candidatus Thorarchaeota archaeon]|nr:hypothetical protein [Candidatus Thorarchaeota archaeon]